MEENHNNVNEVLDNIAVECGEPLKENETYTVAGESEINQKAEEVLSGYAYDNRDMLIPGQEVGNKISDSLKSDKNSGLNEMIAQAAIMKADKERKQIEEVRRKKEARADLLAQLMYQQEEMYYTKHHYKMSGPEKRKLRRMLEKNYDKGKYKNLLQNTGGIPLN